MPRHRTAPHPATAPRATAPVVTRPDAGRPRAGRPRTNRPHRWLGLAGVVALALSACSMTGGGSSAPTTGTTGAGGPAGTTGGAGTSPGAPAAYRCTTDPAVTLVTHDSFGVGQDLLDEFTRATGCVVTVARSGDAGALANKLVLTKSSPIGDVVYGIDNAFAGRTVQAGVFAPFAPALPPGAAAHALTGPGAAVLTPIDFGDVCVNVDTAWFTTAGRTPPATLDDLTKPENRDLFVTPGATSSSPGFAFLLATIGAKGEAGWQDYWTRLMANGAKLTSGWSDAYEVDFTASGKGNRPIVLSYASSPPFTIPQGGSTPTTAALLDTCFRQVEYAGVLAGAKNPDGAKAFVDYLLTKPVQESIPDSMYMFPVSGDAALPPVWAQWAKVAPQPFTVAPEAIERNRDQWLRDWTEVTAK